MSTILKILITIGLCFAHSQTEELTHIFTDLHTHKQWAGSTAQATWEYRLFLQNFLRTHAIQSVLDIGCGDWEFSRLMNWTGISYTGIDIVPHMVAQNQRLYGNHHIQFICDDALDAIHTHRADLVIIKDVLHHLKNDLILELLDGCRHFKYCILVNGGPAANNVDLYNNGPFRPVDLLKAPFGINCRGREILMPFEEGVTKQVIVVEQ